MQEINAVAPARGDAVLNLAMIFKPIEHPDRAKRQRDDKDRGDERDEVAVLFFCGLGRRRPADLIG